MSTADSKVEIEEEKTKKQGTFEELPPEYLKRLAEGLKKYEEEIISTGGKVTTSGRKKKEKEIRRNLTKELKAAKREEAKASSSETPSDAASSSSTPSSSIQITNSDPTAPEVKVGDVPEHLGERIHSFGWVSSIRMHGKNLVFIALRNLGKQVQCVAHGALAKSDVIVNLTRESTIDAWGTVQKGTTEISPFEILLDYVEVIGPCPAEFEQLLNPDSGVEQRMNYRHLQHRGDILTRTMRVRSRLLFEYRKYLYSKNFEEVTPPTIVKNACEGGSEMFAIKYYDQTAFLTESSQLYLETVIQSLGNVFCILPSYRAEKSTTRRHLAEFTHLEAEMPFMEFDAFLGFIEDFICTVIDKMIEVCKDDLSVLNKDFKPLQRPFKRMTYMEAIQWLKDHDVKKEDGTYYEYPDDIPEKPERFLVDTINVPVMLMRFPACQKAFYMKKCKDDPLFTESVDVLVPTVGEIIGGSSRISDYDELCKVLEERKMDPKPFNWYLDLRKYGTAPHSGFGLGVERILCWLTNTYHIRDACMYPRYMGRVTP